MAEAQVLSIAGGCPYAWDDKLKVCLKKTGLDIFTFFARAWEHARHTGDRYRAHAAKYKQSLHTKNEPQIPGFVRVFIQVLETAVDRAYDNVVSIVGHAQPPERADRPKQRPYKRLPTRR